MDYYKILEVTPTASDEVVRMAYKALAKKYHPDLYKGDKEFAQKQMSDINQAYEALSNPTKRSAYDESRAEETNQTNWENNSTVNTDSSQPGYTDTSAQETTWTPYGTPEYHPPQSPTFYKRKPPIGRWLWRLIKFAVVILLIYGIFSGKMIGFFKGNFNTVQNAISAKVAQVEGKNIVKSASQSIGKIIGKTARQKEEHLEIKDAVENYLISLQKIDHDATFSAIDGDRITEVTDGIISVYDGFNTPDKFGYELMKESRKFRYDLDPAILGADGLSATVDCQINVANLHAVVVLAQMDTSKKLTDDDWVNEYAIKSALSGNTEVSEIDVLNDSIKEELKKKTDTLEYDVRFILKKSDDKWLITGITDDKDFANAVTGNAIDLIRELLQAAQ